jgi:hypothetical protein
MGICASSTAVAVADLKTRLVVNTPSERGRILDGPAGDTVVLTLTAAGGARARDGSWNWWAGAGPVEVRDAATGAAVLSVSRYSEEGQEPLSFFGADGKLVAFKDKPQKKNGSAKLCDFWAARPAISGQASAKEVGGVPLYYWGMFKYAGENGYYSKPIQYVERRSR